MIVALLHVYLRTPFALSVLGCTLFPGLPVTVQRSAAEAKGQEGEARPIQNGFQLLKISVASLAHEPDLVQVSAW